MCLKAKNVQNVYLGFFGEAKLSGEREGGIIRRLGKNKGITIGAKNGE